MTKEEQMYRVTRYVWYIFYAVEALLAFRVILKLLAANPAAAFTQFIYNFSGLFVSPFRYVFKSPSAGSSTLELNVVLAMIVYYVLAWGIVKLIVMNRDVSSYEAKSQLEEQDKV